MTELIRTALPLNKLGTCENDDKLGMATGHNVERSHQKHA